MGERNKIYRQIFVAFIANISSFAVGTTVGWTSPNIPKLQDILMTDTPLDRIVTSSEVGWFGSLASIGGAISPIFAGPLAKKFGRKFVLITSAANIILSYIILGVTNGIELMYTARLLQGFSIGLTMSIMPVYVGEISQNTMRGPLGSFMMLFITSGILFAYSVAPFVPYATYQFICCSFPIAFILIFMFLPESPIVHLIAGNRHKAIESLIFLRGTSQESVLPQIDEIQTSIIASQNLRGNWRNLFTNRGNLRAVITLNGLMLAQQFSGISAVLYYAQSIFTRAGGSFEPEISSIITGIMLVAGCFAALFVVERYGRKINLIISGVGMAIGTLLLSIYFFLDAANATVVDSIGFLPIISLVVYLFIYSYGFGTMPWAMMGEMFPPDVKHYATMVVSSLCSVFAVLVLQFFELLNDGVGPQWVFMIFTCFSVAGVIFTYVFVLETKGFTLQEILDRLNKK